MLFAVPDVHRRDDGLIAVDEGAPEVEPFPKRGRGLAGLVIDKAEVRLARLVRSNNP
jgi:hypothetical protein